MVVNLNRHNDRVYVAIEGNVEPGHERELSKNMRLLLKQNFREAIFDLSHVPFMTAPTIGKFLMFYRNATATGRSMRIKGVHDGIYRYFQILRLNRLFPVEK
jgi:anti-anti-sigma factor